MAHAFKTQKQHAASRQAQTTSDWHSLKPRLRLLLCAKCNSENPLTSNLLTAAVCLSLPLQALCPPQADGSSSRLQAWLQCSQLPWLLQAAGALLAYAEGHPEAPELQVRPAS